MHLPFSEATTLFQRASSIFTTPHGTLPMRPIAQLYVARGAEIVVVSGRAAIKLRGREAMRKVVDALVQLRRSNPGIAMTVDEVYAIGWASKTDDATAEARSRRVYTMMSRLRRMGLQDVVITDDTGYRIDPRWQVEQIGSVNDAAMASGF